MSDKLKILFLGPAYPYRGGISSFTDRLALEFLNQGHDVDLFTFRLQYPSLLFPGKTQFSTEPPPSKLIALRVINSINPLNWVRVGKRIQVLQPDIILVRYWIPFLAPALGTILRVAKKKTRGKVICIADNIIPHEKRPADAFLTSYFNRTIDAYVVMSEQVKNDLMRIDKSKPFVFLPHPLFDNFGLPQPSAEARKKLGIGQSDKVILFFGLIREYKGLDLLLKAIAKLDVRAMNIKLIVAGEFYDKKEKYTTLIHVHKLENFVSLEDHFIPNDKVTTYMSAADVLVQPYRHATQSGVTPLAMHFNLPMIVTNVGGLKDMVQDGKTGLVVQPSVDALADGLIEYFKLGKIHFQENIPEFKKQFTWDKMYKGILGLYETII